VSENKGEKFVDLILTSEVDIANGATKQLLYFGSLIINLYVFFLLMTQTGNLTGYHFIAAIGIIASIYLSIYLARKINKNSFYLINQIYLLLLPVMINQHVTKPWISYGLLVVITVFFAATYESTPLFGIILVASPIIQFLVADKNLLGITDNKDLLYLGTFFSSTWVITAGLGSRIVQLFYFKYCAKIDEELNLLQEEMVDAGANQKSLNLKDYRNLAIHGTLLNTLITYKQLPDMHLKQKSLAFELQKDLDKVGYKNITIISDLKNRITEVLDSFNLKSEIIFEGNFQLTTVLYEPIFEIIREIGLNIKKHTDSDQLRIYFYTKGGKSFVKVIEITPIKLNDPQLKEKLKNSGLSKSLNRLANSAKIKIQVQSGSNNKEIEYLLELPLNINVKLVLEKIINLRANSLNTNVRLFTLITLVYSFLAIIGFIVTKVDFYIVGCVLIANLLLSFELFSKSTNHARLILSQTLLLTITPFMIFLGENCSDLLYAPWLFNTMLGTLVYAIAVTTIPVIRWLPCGLFILENLVARNFFPASCYTILDGSVPGFILILVLGYFLTNIRKSNTQKDSLISKYVGRDLNEVNETVELVKQAREKVLINISELINNLQISHYNENELELELQIYIQKVRAFLICSQYFANDEIQFIYQLIMERLEKTGPTKISILSNEDLNFARVDLHRMATIFKSDLSKELEILITQEGLTKIQLLIDGQSVQKF